MRAAVRRGPSIHSLTIGAHSIAPTWASKRCSSASDKASQLGAASSASQSSEPTASAARWRSRCASAARCCRLLPACAAAAAWVAIMG
jgi:hypothetical protein